MRQVISRHRIPAPYRQMLTLLWLVLPLLLIVTLATTHPLARLLHPGLLAWLLLCSLPAYYTWQEGLDITQQGVIIRIRGWRFYAYADLRAWTVRNIRNVPVLTLWSRQATPVLECPAAHLTNLQELQKNLQTGFTRR